MAFDFTNYHQRIQAQNKYQQQCEVQLADRLEQERKARNTMNTKPTTQQLAQNLADALDLRQRLSDLDGSTVLELKYNYSSCQGLVGKALPIPRSYCSQVLSAIKAEIDKEANSIKKQLQEALASE